MLNFNHEIKINPGLADLYRNARAAVYAELEKKQRPKAAPKATEHGTDYGKAALTAELANVRGASEGERNGVLNTAAFSLGQLVGGGELVEDLVTQSLLDAALEIGLPRQEAERTIASGFKAGMAEPRSAAPRVEDEPDVEDEQSEKIDPKKVLKYLYSNQDGDAKLYIELHRGQLVYDHAAGQWFKWAGHYWTEDLLDEATTAIEAVIDTYAVEARRQAWNRVKATKENKPDDEFDCAKKERDLLKRVKALQVVSRKKDVLQLARTGRKSLGITGNEWDRDPMILGCPNGVIELKTGAFRPGQQDDYIKTVTGAEWKGLDTPAQEWICFLNEIFGGDRNLVSYTARLFGYGVTGLNREHIIPFMWGAGRNGKGTLLETTKFVLGPLAYKTESELLLDQSFAKNAGAPNSATLALRGKRIVWASETSEGRRLNTGKLKELVGGDTLNARGIHARRHVEFGPTHLLLLLTNSKPHAPANDYALWQRIHLIPFTLSFIDNPTKENERQADKTLSEKLKAEGAGILAWLVRGCLEYQKQGLNPPSIVKQAVEEYRQEEDIVGHFITDDCVVEPGAKVRASDFFEAYKRWCMENGHKAISGTRFGTDMKSRFDWDESGRHRYYIGIGLKND